MIEKGATQADQSVGSKLRNSHLAWRYRQIHENNRSITLERGSSGFLTSRGETSARYPTGLDLRGDPETEQGEARLKTDGNEQYRRQENY